MEKLWILRSSEEWQTRPNTIPFSVYASFSFLKHQPRPHHPPPSPSPLNRLLVPWSDSLSVTVVQNDNHVPERILRLPVLHFFAISLISPTVSLCLVLMVVCCGDGGGCSYQDNIPWDPIPTPYGHGRSSGGGQTVTRLMYKSIKRVCCVYWWDKLPSTTFLLLRCCRLLLATTPPTTLLLLRFWAEFGVAWNLLLWLTMMGNQCA